MTTREIGGVQSYVVDAEGPPIGTESDARDLIGALWGSDATLIVLPVARLHPDFLVLGTRMAGDFLQKMSTYSYRIAILGDMSRETARSTALRDFISESNRGGQVLFLPDEAALDERLRQG